MRCVRWPPAERDQRPALFAPTPGFSLSLGHSVFFLCFSLHGWEKSMREQDKKQHKTSKKKHSATPASSTLRRQRFLDVLTINQQANVALFGTSRSMLHQSRANLPRIMWRFLFNFHTFLGKSLSSYHLRQGKGPARLQFLHATKRQKKNENRPVRDESCSIAQTHGCAKRCILCFFSCVFFSRVWKNQWARVTRNKEKTRRGLSDQK